MSSLRRWLIPPVLALLLGAGLLLSTPSATATATSSSAASSAASATHVLRIRFWHRTVRVTVPGTWHVSRTAPTSGCGCASEFPPVCIVAHGDYDQDPYRCELIVGGGERYQTFDLPLPSWRLPRCGRWDTAYESGGRLGRWPAQYRIFLDRCHDRKAEQWVSESVPSVGLWHPLSWGADDTAAAAAARSLRVSGKVVVKRLSDVGRVQGVKVIDGHAYVTLDRVVQSLDGGLLNRSHETYRYRLHTPVRAARWAACLRDWTLCNATQLRQQFGKGARPADGTRPLAGRAVMVTRDEAFPRVFDLIRLAWRFRFTSSGDPGSCGC